ncbi:MAG: YHS domain-containing protein [Planctomycetes bacterium]|nr:YHS domain-containing protein [Planctomycetota bacterium]
MKPMSIVLASSWLLAFACASSPSASVDGIDEPRYLVNRDAAGLVIDGYDPVAYFTDGKPVPGDPDHRTTWQGGTYQFASKDHLAMFEADPQKYAPAFGGWCGYAVSIDKLSPVDPRYWEILDGRLVLQHNERAWNLWHEDVAANLKRADANWPGLVEENASPQKRLVNVDDDGVALEGHDPVAYFTDHRPIPGKPEFSRTFDGATYRFASKEHLDLFERDPAKYVPKYGGYCGYAASIDKVSPVNVHVFQIVDGRLVLQHTPEAYRLWNLDVARSSHDADHHWTGLVERCGE